MFITFCNWLFAEEEIDGELLVQLVEGGRSEHLQRLGLKQLKDKLKFRKMLPATAGTQPIPTTSCSSFHTVERKLTISEMQSLTAGEKHVYLIKGDTCMPCVDVCLWPWLWIGEAKFAKLLPRSGREMKFQFLRGQFKKELRPAWSACLKHVAGLPVSFKWLAHCIWA